MTKTMNFIQEEIFFGAEINFVKKVLWAIIATFVVFFSPMVGASIILSLCGLYYKKGGKVEVTEFIKIQLGFLSLPVLFVVFGAGLAIL